MHEFIWSGSFIATSKELSLHHRFQGQARRARLYGPRCGSGLSYLVLFLVLLADFLKSLLQPGVGIKKGVFVTMQGYSAEAKTLAEQHAIEILNKATLLKLLGSTNARFDPELIDLLNDTRRFCPKCRREMALKTAMKGPNPGEQFWSCTGFPKYCSYTMRCS